MQKFTKTGLSFFFISLSTLIYEILLIRILSILMFYSIVSLIISLSLFGIGLGALLVYLFPLKFNEENIDKFAKIFSFALLIPIFLLFFIEYAPDYFSTIINIFHPPLYQPFKTSIYTSNIPMQTYLFLTIFFLLFSIPFFFSGITSTLLISSNKDNISKLYFFDLIGASCGSLIIIPLLNYLGAPSSILLNSALAFLGVIFQSENFRKSSGKFFIIPILLLLTLTTYYYQIPKINFVRGYYEPNIVYSKWNAMSRIVVHKGKIQMFPNRISKTFHGNIPSQLGMAINDTGYTIMVNFDQDLKKIEYVKYLINSLVYYTDNMQDRNIMLIGPGGGEDILGAYYFKPKTITAIEINPTIVEIVNENFKDFTGAPYSLPSVTTIVENARSYIKYSSNKYDIISASLVYEWFEPVAGAFSLSQSHLYTKEGFVEYFNHLNPNGILNITRIADRRALRFTAMAEEALISTGATSPKDHIFIASSGGLASFLFKRTPFTPNELQNLKDNVKKLNFKILYSPDMNINNRFYELIKTQNLQEYYKNNEYNFSPATDDKPFFNFLIKPSVFFSFDLWTESGNFEDKTIYILKEFFIISIIMACTLFVIPLLFSKTRKKPDKNLFFALVYFACIGFGFMLIEISFMNKFNILVSHPILSVSIILFSMLLAGGLGSLSTSKIKNPVVALVLLNLQILSYIIFMDSWINSIQTPNIFIRSINGILILFPIGFLMGMPFPLGIKMLYKHDYLIPWVWSVNIGMGVLGAISAFIFAINFGFTITLYIALTAYFIALIIGTLFHFSND